MAFTSRSGDSAPKARGRQQRSSRALKGQLRGAPIQNRNKKGGRRDYSPENEDRYFNEDSATLGQYSLFGEQALFVPTTKQLDSVDKAAIKRWRKHVKKARKKGQLKQNDDVELHDLSKMVNLYKIYGNDAIALVNPAENPGILQVRTRSAEKRRINKQMGIPSNVDYS